MDKEEEHSDREVLEDLDDLEERGDGGDDDEWRCDDLGDDSDDIDLVSQNSKLISRLLVGRVDCCFFSKCWWRL